MCNRYRLKARPDELIDLFELSRDTRLSAVAAEFFPGKPAPVIYQHQNVRRFEGMTWGFPPFKGKRPVNNTRSEKAASSPFWSRHLGNRCVFPLTEVIEWQHQANPRTGELRKAPHTIRFRDQRIGIVAGIYSAEADDPCCSMMTCRVNRMWSTIHNARPTRPRRRAGQSALRRVMRTFFNGSLQDTVAAHLSDPGGGPSEQELKQLAKLIDEARRNKR